MIGRWPQWINTGRYKHVIMVCVCFLCVFTSTNTGVTSSDYSSNISTTKRSDTKNTSK